MCLVPRSVGPGSQQTPDLHQAASQPKGHENTMAVTAKPELRLVGETEVRVVAPQRLVRAAARTPARLREARGGRERLRGYRGGRLGSYASSSSPTAANI